MLLGRLATDDTAIGSTTLHPALKTIVSKKCKARIFFKTRQQRIQVHTWQVPGAAVTTGPGAAVVAGAAVVVATVSGWEKACSYYPLNKRLLCLFLTLNRARGITVSPGANSTDMNIVGISLGGAPRCGVSIDGGAAEVSDVHVGEGEDAGRSLSRAGYGRAGGP